MVLKHPISCTNTLAENIADAQKRQVDVVLANPPFGGKERTEYSKFPSRLLKLRIFPPALHQDYEDWWTLWSCYKEHLPSNTDNASVATQAAT